MMGVATFAIGLLPSLRDGRRARAGAADGAAAGPGLRARRRVGRRGADRLRARRPGTARLLGVAGRRPARPAGQLIANGLLALLAVVAERRRRSWPGAGGSRSCCPRCWCCRAVDPAVGRGVAGVPAGDRARRRPRRRRRHRQDADPRACCARYPREMLTAMGARFAENVSLLHLHHRHHDVRDRRSSSWPSSFALNAVLIAAADALRHDPDVGRAVGPDRPQAGLPDRRGRRRGVGASRSSRCSTPRASRSPVLAVIVGLLFHGAMYGPQAAFFSELFGTKVRYSGRLDRLPARLDPRRRPRPDHRGGAAQDATAAARRSPCTSRICAADHGGGRGVLPRDPATATSPPSPRASPSELTGRPSAPAPAPSARGRTCLGSARCPPTRAPRWSCCGC